MAELNQRDAKLVQYLTEAHGKERELEVALQAHIAMTNRAPYKKRLQAHLRETKGHAKDVERRVKKIGGDPSNLVARTASAGTRAMAAAKGPLHMLRGSGEEEKLLKNAKTEYWNEHEEIATYRAIETLAESVGDKETAKLARSIRRDEERMAKYLEGLIPTLTKAVATSEIPRDQRDSGTRRRRRSTRRRTSGSTARRTRSGSTARKRSTSARGSSASRSSSARSTSRSRSGGRSGRSRARSRS